MPSNDVRYSTMKSFQINYINIFKINITIILQTCNTAQTKLIFILLYFHYS
jgi:hypothetical protein